MFLPEMKEFALMHCSFKDAVFIFLTLYFPIFFTFTAHK